MTRDIGDYDGLTAAERDLLATFRAERQLGRDEVWTIVDAMEVTPVGWIDKYALRATLLRAGLIAPEPVAATDSQGAQS